MDGGSKYITPGAKEPIEVQLFDTTTGKPLLSKSDIFLRVRRTNDDTYLDWNDNQFKVATFVAAMYAPMPAVSDVYSPGIYRLDHPPNHVKGFDTSNIVNAGTSDVYDVTVTQIGGEDAAGLPTGFELHVRQEITLPSQIADAVWGAMQADHKVLNSFGDLMRRIVALQKEHYVIDNMVHNSQGLLTAARIRLFENKTDVLGASDGGAGEGEFATYSFKTTPDGARPVLADVVRSMRDS
jgi:hypothetical protein